MLSSKQVCATGPPNSSGTPNTLSARSHDQPAKLCHRPTLDLPNPDRRPGHPSPALFPVPRPKPNSDCSVPKMKNPALRTTQAPGLVGVMFRPDAAGSTPRFGSPVRVARKPVSVPAVLAHLPQFLAEPPYCGSWGRVDALLFAAIRAAVPSHTKFSTSCPHRPNPRTRPDGHSPTRFSRRSKPLRIWWPASPRRAFRAKRDDLRARVRTDQRFHSSG
jgi:hypothetical protein